MGHQLSTAQREGLRQRLEEQKQELEHRLEENGHFGIHESLRDSITELSAYDNHPADLGTETFERGKDLALNERARIRLDHVSHALQRMKEGSYGTCLICDELISFARLDAVPETSYCLDHAEDKQVSDRRPAEEYIIAPTFYGLDGSDDSNTVMENDEADEYVESFERFVATDLFGKEVTIIRNDAYREYINQVEDEDDV
jgi:YteA family regulatory protein